MVKQYIIRNEIYHDEIRFENRFNQQRCVILEKQRHALVNINGEQVKVIVRDLYYFIAYVKSDEKAIEIATRWITEERQKNNEIYEVKWVDSNYSIFN